MRQGIVLLGHGTKDPEGAGEFLGYAAAVAEATGELVMPGVLEYPTAALPDVQTAFDRVAALVDEVIILPALLFFAGHTRDDVPAVVARARARHPSASILLAGPLGGDDRLLQALEDRMAPFAPDARTAVLLVGRGSLNSEANADLFKTARLIWDRAGAGWVEAAFVSVAPPDVPAGIERCARLGARRVVAVPYFLNTGVLVKRIARQARHETVEVQTAPHLGLHPLVIDILLDRLRQARAGMCPCEAAAACRIPSLECQRGTRCLQPA